MVVVDSTSYNTSYNMRIISKASKNNNNNNKKERNKKRERRSVFAIAMALALFLLSSTIVTVANNNNNNPPIGNIIKQADAYTIVCDVASCWYDALVGETVRIELDADSDSLEVVLKSGPG
jgi:hypothetical protein